MAQLYTILIYETYTVLMLCATCGSFYSKIVAIIRNGTTMSFLVVENVYKNIHFWFHDNCVCINIHI